MNGRAFLYCVLGALVVAGGVFPFTFALVALEKQFGPLGAGTDLLLVLGGTVGVMFLGLFPLSGLVYRHDREAFRQLAAPRYGVARPPTPPPPLRSSSLRQAALWLGGLAALADVLVLMARQLGLGAWVLPGVLSGLGLYLALTLWAGGTVYLRLRGPL